MEINKQLQEIYIEKRPTIIDQESLPSLISNQVDQMKELDRKVKFAMSAAKNAKQSAIEASEKSAGFGRKKVAIEELQSAQVDIAKAVEIGVEAQKTSFEFQSKLAEISKSLFALGVNNIANNRVVIRELEKRLEGASEEEISELAQQELMQVLAQLKAQEDIMKKLENHTSNILQLRETLVQHFNYSRQLNENIFEHKFAIEKQDEMMINQSENLDKISLFTQEQKHLNRKNQEKLKKIDGQLSLLTRHSENFSSHVSEQEKFNNMYDLELKNIQLQLEQIHETNKELQNQLQLLTIKDEELMQILQSHQTIHESLKEKINNQSMEIQEANNVIQQLKSANNQLMDQLNMKSNTSFTKVALAIASLGTVIGIVGLFV